MDGCKLRRGLTLVELLVVIFIIGMLIILFFPARRGAREAARRASCSVKLKNIAIAMHTFHDNFQHLPSSVFYQDGGNLADHDVGLSELKPGRAGGGRDQAPYSFLVKILPYIEASDTYERIDFKTNEAFAQANLPLAAKIIPVFSCPSFRGNMTSTAPEYSTAKLALANYKAIGASTLACLQDSASVTRDDLNGGVFHPYAHYKFDDLKAPTQTIFLAETKEEKYAAWWDGTTASMPGFHPGSGNVKDDRQPNTPPSVPALNLSAHGPQQAFISAAQFGGREDMQWGPSSEHPGLVNHVFGGTETRSIANDIDPAAYRAMISRRAADNAVIGDELK